MGVVSALIQAGWTGSQAGVRISSIVMPSSEASVHEHLTPECKARPSRRGNQVERRLPRELVWRESSPYDLCPNRSISQVFGRAVNRRGTAPLLFGRALTPECRSHREDKRRGEIGVARYPALRITEAALRAHALGQWRAPALLLAARIVATAEPSAYCGEHLATSAQKSCSAVERFPERTEKIGLAGIPERAELDRDFRFDNMCW